MGTLHTLLHSENRGKLVAVVAGTIVLLANYAGTLPAPLDHYKDWIDLLAYVVIGLNLVNMQPKREL